MNFREYLKNNIVVLDGGMGTLLQKKGLLPGEHPEAWNLSHPEEITEIHKAYYDAGSNVVNINTFGANPLKFSDSELQEIIKAAIQNADKARKLSNAPQEKFIALDIGPSGRLLKPFGDLDFEDAIEAFAKVVRIGVKYGVDLVTIETMNDCYETKAAVLAVKENCDLPFIVTNAYGLDGKLMTGAEPSAMVAMLEGLGADAIGANCSLGPAQLIAVAEDILSVSSTPVAIKPNAGLPKVENGKTVFDVTSDEFADIVAKMCEKGVRIVGGCCGTTPEYISKLCAKIKDIKPSEITDKNISCVSSYTHAVEFSDSPVLIGERINPTGKKRFKQALAEHDIDYILREGLNQQEKGVHILDVNVGLPEIDEPAMLKEAVCELQAIINLPLQIDTADFTAMENAMRAYNGKPMVNSVNGKQESMDAIFPLVKKYGGLVVALTLDENGIPDNVEGRIAIAKKIIAAAEKYGIPKKNLIFDTLAMTISADRNAAKVTLESLRKIRNELGCHTSLGVSNVSFGLPARDGVNSTFFTMALTNGLSAAIMNPYSAEMMKSYYSYKALSGLDENCSDYIEFSATIETTTVAKEQATSVKAPTADNESIASELQKAIIKGRKESALTLTRELIKTVKPLDIVENEIIPALDVVGKGFEAKTVYLPQLLMSAESAQASFEVIKENMQNSGEKQESKFNIVIATVKGDIHDIGKNIVKLLLQNYGFNVTDLGKDVPAEVISDKVCELDCPLCCLSALMTTTVPAMEETIKLLRKTAPGCKVMVGGAVLNKEYADMIGADLYAKDAMEAVRQALEL
ncbi:MAG: homocysteine S-methyltransferase family protein [Clostridia bacterium]|nr:homocysteine S-methyltransferase family protein [Clostridia bacterium]